MSASVTAAAPSWVPRLLAGFDASDQRARELLRGLTRAQLNWREHPHTWSVGQCLDHLCVANDVYLPPIAAGLEGKPMSPVDEIEIGWFGSWFIRDYIEPSAQTKHLKAPKKITPAPDVEPAVLDRFLRGNEQARELVRRAAGHDVNRLRFRNPFVPLLRFTVGTGLEIVVRHQRRHLLQAERVRVLGSFPK